MAACRPRSAASRGAWAFQLNPTLPGAAAAAAIAGQIQQAYLKNSIASAAATAADIIRQNAMLNALEDTSKIVGQKVNDPAAMGAGGRPRPGGGPAKRFLAQLRQGS
jgi:hypothetical protein